MALAAGPAFAQAGAAAPPVNWTQALDAAWQRAQARAENERNLLEAQAQQAAAQSPWAAAPAVQLQHRSGRSPGEAGSVRESEAALSWPIWLPGQRQSRLDAADAEIRAARAAVDAARLRLAGELRDSGGAVLAQEAELRQAELEVRLLQSLAEDVERRVHAGDLARSDAMGARAELLQAQVNQQSAAQRLQLARDRWQLLTGLAAVPPPGSPGSAGAGEHPEIVAAAARVERARRRLEAVEKTRREPPEVGVSVRRETDNTGSASSLGVSLRVPFGGERLNAPALAQARGDLDVALQDEQRTRERLALETSSARLQVQGATQQLASERSRAGLLRERAGLIERSFRAGESALPELLRALAAAAQADAAVVRQQAALAQAQARLSQSLGLLP